MINILDAASTTNDNDYENTFNIRMSDSVSIASNIKSYMNKVSNIHDLEAVKQKIMISAAMYTNNLIITDLLLQKM